MPTIFNHPRLEMVSISSIHPNPNRPRKSKPGQIEQLVASLRRFGFRGAILVDDDAMIVAGNALYEAALQARFGEVPIIRTSFLNDAERRAFILAHNRTAELSEFDEQKLSAELEFLFEANGHLDGTGFKISDLDFSIPADPGEIERVELPSADAAAVSRLGDLWFIGPDLRLFNGDARDVASFETLLGDERAQIVFGDLPYNVPIDGHVGGHGQVKPRTFKMAVGEMSVAEFTTFLRTIFRNCARFSTSGSLHLQCMDWRHLSEILDAASGVYTEFKQLVVWVKPTGGQGAFMRSRHELVLIFKSGRGKHRNNVMMGQSGRNRTNVVEYAGASGFYKGRAQDLADHSTVKPTALIIDFLLDFSNRDDLVLDPCAGSGSVLLAAHKTKRRGAALEIDPVFVDTALRRLRQATGISPTLVDGRSFEQVAIDRREGGDHE